MPDMDGVEASRRIRQLSGRGATVPIIAVTANAMAGNREKYLAAGMDDYITKPIQQEGLIAMVEIWAVADCRAAQNDTDGSNESEPEDDAEPRLRVPDGNPGAALEGSEVGSQGCIDDAVVRELEELLGGTDMGALVRENIEAAQARIGRMLDAVNEEDIATIQKEAHDLKSTLGSLGAIQAHTAAATLEQACKDGRIDEVVRLSPDVNQIVDDALNQLSTRYPEAC